MICEFRNQMVRFAGYIIDGEYNHWLDEKETDLYSTLCAAFSAGVLLLAVGWVVIPLRWILAPLKRIKFVCKKKDEDD